MPRKAVIAVALIVAAAASYFLFIYSGNNEGEEAFRTTGTVEALEYSIESKVAGRLVFIGFREGDRVATGELVARINPAEMEARLSQARAAVVTAERALASGRDAVENARARHEAAKSEAERARSETERARTRLAQAETDLGRAEELFGKGFVSKSDLDAARTERDSLAAGLDAARSASEAAGSETKSAAAAVREAESNVGTLKARVAEAGSALELAEVQLADTEMYSPADAVVDYRYREPGEMVAPGSPILTLVDEDDKWVRMDIDERYIGRVKQGQKADITLEYMPDRTFGGVIFDIGREAGFATERDVTRGRQDIRTFRTKIRVDDPEGVLKPGMTVMVTVPLI